MWSVAHGPQVLALICGLALTPLLLAIAWMVVVAVTRFLADRRALGARSAARGGVVMGTQRPAAPPAAAPARRRSAAFSTRRLRRGARRPAPHLPEQRGRQPVDTGRASSPERIAA
jgi:hypothetical protein